MIKEKTNTLDQHIWLFMSYGGGHVKALLPVAKKIKKEGLASPVYFALTTAIKEVRESGIECLTYSDLILHEGESEQALWWGRKLAEDLSVNATEVKESIAYLGLNYVDLISRLGVQGAANAYAKHGRQSFFPQFLMERMLKKVNPALVVTTNSPRSEQAALQAARSLKIPSVCVLDLFANGPDEKVLLSNPNYSDAICVINDSVRMTLIDGGRLEKQVYVTGNPAMDHINDFAIRKNGKVLRERQAWNSLHVILYAPSPEPIKYNGILDCGDPQLPDRIEKRLVETVIKNPKLAMWVRRHPSQEPATMVTQLNHPRIKVSDANSSLHEVLHASDEVVVICSTVGLEAHIAGKFVTQITGSILDSLSPYLEMGIADRRIGILDIPVAFENHVFKPRAKVSDVLSMCSACDNVVEVLKDFSKNMNHMGQYE